MKKSKTQTARFNRGRHNNGMHPTPHHEVSHARRAGARVMPSVGRFLFRLRDKVMKSPTPEQFGISEQHIEALKRKREQYEKVVPKIFVVMLLFLSVGFALMVALFDPKAAHGGIGSSVGMFFAAFVLALFFGLPLCFVLSHVLYEALWIFERMSKWKRNVDRYERAVKDYNLWLKGAEPQKTSKSGVATVIIAGLLNPVSGAYFFWNWLKGGFECDLCRKRIPVSAYDISRGRFGKRYRYSMDVICDECWFKAKSRLNA